MPPPPQPVDAPAQTDARPSTPLERAFPGVPVLDLRDQRPPTAPPSARRDRTPTGPATLLPGGRPGIYSAEDLANQDGGAVDLRGLTPRNGDGSMPADAPAPPSPKRFARTELQMGAGATLNLCDHCGTTGAEKRCGRCWDARRRNRAGTSCFFNATRG